VSSFRGSVHVPIESAGFRGSEYDGIDIALDVMLKKLIKDRGKDS
jgi:nitrogenase molybdenum-iron protein alpha/beta subunit